MFDVEELPTHGGSLRLFGCHVDDARATAANVGALLAEDPRRGLQRLDTYADFRPVRIASRTTCSNSLSSRRKRKKVRRRRRHKGNTLLNYAGVKPDLLPFVCDAAPSKQGKFLPGSHVPVLPPDALRERLAGLRADPAMEHRAGNRTNKTPT